MSAIVQATTGTQIRRRRKGKSHGLPGTGVGWVYENLESRAGMQNPKNNWARVGVLAALMSVCLGLVCAWLHNSEERDKRRSVAGSEMQRARNRDTSNFDNVLQF